jgi:hypothetical protein
MSLPVRHRLLSVRSAAARHSLLPYKLRQSAADEMLYGGVRVTALVTPPPAVKYTASEQLTLPTLESERADMQLNWTRIQHLLTPVNLHFEMRHEFARIKNVDLLRRWKALPKTAQPRSSELTVAPRAAPYVLPHTTTSLGVRSVYDFRTFMPLQTIKPMQSGGVGSVSYRGRGLRHALQEQYQERLNRRGFGAKKNMPLMKELHPDTVGYRPRRGY